MSVLAGAAIVLAGLPMAAATPDAAAPAEAAAPATVRHSGQPGSIAGSYIVILKDSVHAASVASVASDLAARHGGAVKLTYTATVRGFSLSASSAQAARLAADPAVPPGHWLPCSTR